MDVLDFIEELYEIENGYKYLGYFLNWIKSYHKLKLFTRVIILLDGTEQTIIPDPKRFIESLAFLIGIKTIKSKKLYESLIKIGINPYVDDKRCTNINFNN